MFEGEVVDYDAYERQNYDQKNLHICKITFVKFHIYKIFIILKEFKIFDFYLKVGAKKRDKILEFLVAQDKTRE